MIEKDLIEKAAELLQQCETVVLTSINKEGYPRPVPVSKIKTDGVLTIWMATGIDSVRTGDFLLNPKAGLCFYEKRNSVALTGEVEMITDERQKAAFWQEWFIHHFSGGPADPNYVLLSFKALDVTYWIDGMFIH